MTYLRDHADDSYRLLDASITPAQALDALAESRYAVVQQDGTVIGIGTADDLAMAAQRGAPRLADPLTALPPAVLVPADWSVSRLVESDTVTLMDLTDAGIVLMEGEQPVGVVALDRIRAAVAAEHGGVWTRPLGDGDSPADAMLPGDFRIGRARVVCSAPGCGYVNTLDFFDRFRPPDCVNPDIPRHSLLPGR